MPLSEFLRMANRRIESGQHKPCPIDPSSRSDNELVELVWENGQIMMQGQSSRVTRPPALSSLPCNTHKVRDARIGKFGGVESILNDMSPEVDLSQNDEMVPWLDALTQDYSSVLLPEISGVTANGMSTQSSFVSVDKKTNCEQTATNLHSGGNDTLNGLSLKARLLCSWPPQHRQTSDALGSGVSDVVTNNTSKHPDVVFGNPAQSTEILNGSTSTKPTNNNSNYLNFSHFARPVNLIRANVTSERAEVKEKGSGSSGSYPVKSKLVERVTSAKDSCPPERIENLCQENCIKNDKPQMNTTDSTKGVPYGERTVEPMVVSSSVGSGNSADRVSCEQTLNSKRKFHDTDESECRSDDIETESVGVKKPTHGRVSGSKRSRAAEVHNLSERRRRDRINEKMRALQELIPNCNKADKASMLDEAIEYLKTLQLQVQMMSMGAGLCMPPMMYPTGMQHMHPAHIPQFPPMGVGMGMGFGMGMFDMNGGSPVFPVSPLQAPHFPSSMPANFHRMPGPNLPVYGHNMVPLAGQQPSVSAMGLSTMTNGNHNAVRCTSPVLNTGDIMTDANSQLKCNAEAGSSINQKPNQIQVTNEVLNQSSTVQENKRATDDSGPAVLTSTTATDISKEPGFD